MARLGTAALVSVLFVGAALSSADDRLGAAIAAEVRTAIQGDQRLFQTRIQVDPSGSHGVILSGRVATDAQRTDAIHAAESVPGIRRIVDRLQVGQGHRENQIDLQASIFSAIDRDPAIRADDVIAISVNSGVVDIGGVVDSWAQHRSVTRDAFQAGANVVVNHLLVRQDPTRSERSFVYHRPISENRAVS